MTSQKFSQSLRKIARPLSVLGAIALALPTSMGTAEPASAETIIGIPHDVRRCVQRLNNYTDLTPELIADTCAYSWDANAVSRCVQTIERHTSISANDALNACRKTRRPKGVSRCVREISQIDNNSQRITEASLGYCHRSLLPQRFADCTTALVNQLEIDPAEAMDTCIDGRDRPRDLYPGYPQVF
ncbi:MAG: hypothetical protein AAGA67_09340 [Cyanobacteria bacterium P01_F01_bin.153]